jgi:N-acyl-D-amino-acid deacylase
MSQHDLIIRGGTLIDGTGAPARAADVAIDGGLITEVGDSVGSARREIDARGLIVTPGFVDMHTHYDAQVSWDAMMTPSSYHGCTTVIMGNCGIGFAPVKPNRHDWLIGLMEGVEDIPGAAMHEGIRWGWESFEEYLNVVEASPHIIDFGAQVPHGALRAYVMDERGANNEDATADDIAEMARLTEAGLRAGALGFSTSRTMLHKSIEGVPMPGTFAAQDEVFGIGRALGRVGHGVFQLAGEHLTMAKEFPWMRKLAQEIGRPVVFNISQTDQEPTLWKTLLTQLDEAAADNVPIYAQVAGRSIGIMMCWEGTAHPFAAHLDFLQLKMNLTPEELCAALSQPEHRAKILGGSALELGAFETFITTSYHKMYPMNDRMDYEPKQEDSVASIAQRTGRSPQEVAYDALCANDGHGFLYFPLFNYADNDLAALHALHSHPSTRMGLSDGGAHCGAICDGGMPTFMLTHWTRDRERGPKMALEHIIHRQTQGTARTYGLLDRGVVAPGYRADLNVIDYANLGFGRPHMVYDLPAQGRRLMQRAKGYVATVCSGQVILERDEFTGALPGKLIRGPQRNP